MNEIDSLALDPRLRGPETGSSECFLCGGHIHSEAAFCWVRSPAANSIPVAAHRTCVNGMDGMDLIVRYQSAAFAAASGEGKEEIPWDRSKMM